jgi:hypothetical protein
MIGIQQCQEEMTDVEPMMIKLLRLSKTTMQEVEELGRPWIAEEHCRPPSPLRQ